jgi:secreted trypsin-like serine protease
MKKVIGLRQLCCCLFAVNTFCQAIVISDKFENAASHIKHSDYPELVSLLGMRAAGTLIEESWIITAAHVAEYIALKPESKVVVVQGQVRRIVEVYLHPSWDRKRLGSQQVFDIALLRLDSPIRNAVVANLNESLSEMNKSVEIVGWGRTGNGINPNLIRDKTLRRATNLIEEIEPRLRFTFDKPGTTNFRPLEGVSGPGDSGGPAFIINDNKRILVGISSFQTDLTEPGLYGAVENYERVQKHVSWIHSLIQNDANQDQLN